MPPHCDSMDGPVVAAARRALEESRVEIALPYVPREGEGEVRAAFAAVMAIRDQDPEVGRVADLHFFETVVRVHRAGEGAPYTGLKPAGLDHGPVIPVAERALESGSPAELVELLTDRVAEEVRERLARAMEAKAATGTGVEADRRYVEASLGLQVWANDLYRAAAAEPHEHGHAHGD